VYTYLYCLDEREFVKRWVVKFATDAAAKRAAFEYMRDRDLGKFKETLAAIGHDDGRKRLPEIEDCCGFSARAVAMPKQIVVGCLHQGSKLSVGGGSKSFKTWALDDLGLSVGYGRKWMGWETVRAPVLVCNFELQEAFCQQRLNAIAKAKGIVQEEGRVDVWNLRGYAAPYQTIFPKIVEQVKSRGYGLIILDPIYKLYGDGCDENSARDVAQLMNAVEEVSVETGAAIAFGAHFSKGNQSGKSSMDRVSGSGVFARDPDTLLALTPHEQGGCFTVETVLRNLPPTDPFVVRWDFPLFVRDDSLDPDRLRTKAGREKTFRADQLLACLGDRASTSTEWMKASCCGKTTFYELLRELRAEELVVKDTDGKWVKGRN
jgi:hypothetical protein